MFKDEDKEFEEFMNRSDEDNPTTKSLGAYNFRVGGGNSRSIGSRTNQSSYKRNTAKSIAVDSNIIDKYDIGAKTLPLKARRKKKRKGRRKKRKKKKAKDSDDMIPDSLFASQPLRENQPTNFDSPSDDDEDLFNSVKSRFGEDYVLNGSQKKSFGSKEDDLSRRLSTNDRSLLATGENPIGLSTLDEKITMDSMKDSIDDVGVDEDDMNISFYDMTKDSVGLNYGKKSQKGLFTSSDDDIGGSISSGFGYSPKKSAPKSSTKKVFINGTLVDVSASNDEPKLSTSNINEESVNDTSVDYLDPHSDNDSGDFSSFIGKRQKSSSPIRSNKENEKLKEVIERLKAVNEDQSEKMIRLEAQVGVLEDEKSNLTEEKQDVIEQLSETMTQLGTIQKELEEKGKSVMSLQTTVSELQRQKQEFGELVEEEKHQKEVALQELEKLKSGSILEPSQPTRAEDGERKPEGSDELSKELEEERNMRIQLQDSNEELAEKCERLGGKVSLLENQLKDKNERITALENENNLLLCDVEEWKKKVNKLSQEPKQVKKKGSEVENLERMLKATQDDNERILERLRSYEKMEKENRTKDSEVIKELKQTNSELKETVDLLQSEKEKYSQHSVIIAELRKDKDTVSRVLEEERLSWKSERRKLEEKIAWWKDNQELISDKEKEIDNLKMEVERLKEEGLSSSVMEGLLRENKDLKKRLNQPTRLSYVIRETARKRGEERDTEVESLKNELVEVKDSAAQSMRALRQEFEKTKAQYEERIEELKKKKKVVKVNSGRGVSRKKYLLEKKKFEDQVSEKEEEIKKVLKEKEILRTKSRASSKRINQLERKVNRLKENSSLSKKRENEIQELKRSYEDKIYRLEREKENTIESLKKENETNMIEKENEMRCLPYDEKSRRLMMKVEEQMSRLAGFESKQRVLRMNHATEMEELKAEFEVRQNQIRNEFNKILQNKNLQVKKFKMMLDQIMEDISRYKKVKDFEISQISMIRSGKLRIN